ncbi:hypothetical protein H6F76_00010 [Leptolyngbya sp. FACHB-321]|uniref:hypothetical protein n=1 Tax=Leptolyngbya sp. FACHB-321 TaxID=2692807 RepID=UPI00168577D4|nr:hypothetical protein [Leptolyngbya sp. FACHB-321]MBD2033452.1 hypothetical protein [Leptolyngbya sp. FACHB-321]
MTFLFSMSAWAIVGYGTFSIINSLRKGIATVKHLHEIPCARCQPHKVMKLVGCSGTSN